MKVGLDLSISRFTIVFWQPARFLGCLMRPLGFLNFSVIVMSSSSFSERRFLMTKQIGTAGRRAFDAFRQRTGKGTTVAFSFSYFCFTNRLGLPVRSSRACFSSKAFLFFSSVVPLLLCSRRENSRISWYIGTLKRQTDTGADKLFDCDTLGRSVCRDSGFRT